MVQHTQQSVLDPLEAAASSLEADVQLGKALAGLHHVLRQGFVTLLL